MIAHCSYLGGERRAIICFSECSNSNDSIYITLTLPQHVRDLQARLPADPDLRIDKEKPCGDSRSRVWVSVSRC